MTSPTEPLKILVLVPTQQMADQFQKESLNPLVRFSSPGDILAGHRYHTIVNTVTSLDMGSVEDRIKLGNWIQHVKCRLAPGGQYISMEF